MGADEVKAFLSHLATEMNVAASTQNQAFSEENCKIWKAQEVKNTPRSLGGVALTDADIFRK
jgi:hypothetical protein